MTGWTRLRHQPSCVWGFDWKLFALSFLSRLSFMLSLCQSHDGPLFWQPWAIEHMPPTHFIYLCRQLRSSPLAKCAELELVRWVSQRNTSTTKWPFVSNVCRVQPWIHQEKLFSERKSWEGSKYLMNLGKWRPDFTTAKSVSNIHLKTLSHLVQCNPSLIDPVLLVKDWLLLNLATLDLHSSRIYSVCVSSVHHGDTRENLFYKNTR